MIQASLHGASQVNAFADYCRSGLATASEVSIIIAQTPETPERRWIGDQVVVRLEGDGIRVRDLRPGTFHNCEFWHRLGTVRHAARLAARS